VHDFDQCVIRLGKGNTADKGVYKDAVASWGLCFPTNTIPAKVTHVVVDVDRITTWYQTTLQGYGGNPASLPFTAKDLVANTTAHEIGHAVSLPHHGNAIAPLKEITVQSNPPRVFEADQTQQWEIKTRPYSISWIGLPGNNECGNVSCLMCYRNKSNWVKSTKNNVITYYQVPYMVTGSIFCIEKKGTGINANNMYFGDAIHGECLKNIKLR